MAKPRKGRQRFYLWDYIWWIGEKQKEANLISNVDGNIMLSLYAGVLLIHPVMFLTCLLFSPNSILPLIISIVVAIACYSIISRHYKPRRKAIMRHYAKYDFSMLLTYLIYLLSVFLFCGEIFFFKKMIDQLV